MYASVVLMLGCYNNDILFYFFTFIDFIYPTQHVSVMQSTFIVPGDCVSSVVCLRNKY